MNGIRYSFHVQLERSCQDPCDTNGVPAPSRKLTVLTQGYGEADCFLFFLDNTGYATGA